MDDCTGEYWPDARQHPHRSRRMLGATIHGRRFGSTEALIRDLAPGGLGGSAKLWLAPGEAVEIDLPGLGRVAGCVAWAKGLRFGMRFRTPVDPALVTRETAAGMDPHFRVMERYRPGGDAWRPPIGSLR